MSQPNIVVPGQKLHVVDESTIAGCGTFEIEGYIHASLVGKCHIRRDSNSKTNVLEVHGIRQTPVPRVDDVITVRITNVNPRFAKCLIIGVGDVSLRDSFRAIIRSEDVRATDKDRVDMAKSFRPGDIVIAKVLSLGDSQSFLLSTAENELGVAVALGDAGAVLIPISWCEMQCPITYAKQFRKVAKVQPRFIDISKRSKNV